MSLQSEKAPTGSSAPADAGRETILRPGETCWRIERADRFGLIVDAKDYFAAARSAMLKARQSIVLIGWDFDLRIDLIPDRKEESIPSQLGPFLKEIVRRNPDLRISILKWDMSVLYTMSTQFLPVFALDLAMAKRIRLRFDSTHPWTAAHHQKIAVIDDALAFCGGIDMTTDRWDTRGHVPDDECRTRPNGEPFGPWHDATTVVDGDAARALGELARQRWHSATGQQLRKPDGDGDLWPDEVKPQLRNVDVAIARTMPAYEEQPAVHEVEKLYGEAIRSARRTIYLESQYFASAMICEAIAERLREKDGPEIVVINPLSTEGWLEQQTMGSARDIMLESISRADRHDRFKIFHPVNEAGEPIYVHAKVLIVDDWFLRVGSSNVNNRSMGFDTECDLAVEAKSDQERKAILAIRNDLLAEHLDSGSEAIGSAIDKNWSLLAAIDELRRPLGRSLQPLPVRDPNEAQRALARSHIADPERANRPELLVEHLVKRMVLRLSMAGWMAISGFTIAALSWIGLSRKRRANS